MLGEVDDIRFQGKLVVLLIQLGKGVEKGFGVGGATPPMPPPVPPDLPGAGPGGGGGFRFRQAEIICFQAVSKGDSVAPITGGVTGRRVVPPKGFRFRFIDGTVGSTPSGGTDEGLGVGGGNSLTGLAVVVVLDDEVLGALGSKKLTITRSPLPSILSSAITSNIAWLPVEVITVPGVMSVPQK